MEIGKNNPTWSKPPVLVDIVSVTLSPMHVVSARANLMRMNRWSENQRVIPHLTKRREGILFLYKKSELSYVRLASNAIQVIPHY